MEVYIRKNALLLRGIHILTALAVVAAAAVFSGCGIGFRAELTVERIELTVGESRDILPYVRFLSPYSQDKTLSLEADGDIVDINGSTVTAKKSGVCTVRVCYYESACDLELAVKYRQSGALGLEADGAVQTAKSASEIRPVKLTAALSEYADPEAGIEWSVDGVRAECSAREFVYTPSGYGEYTVTAEAAGMRERVAVRVYKPTITKLVVVGDAEQGEVRSELALYAEEKIEPDNPPSVYEWRVNGAAACESPEFRFTPDGAGMYELSLYVNGVEAGKTEVTASGDRVYPCRVEYDREDGVYIAWEGGKVASRVTIISPNGGRKNVTSSDAQYSYLFEPGKFDATEYIAPCSDAPGTYKITVQTDSVAECEFTQLPSAALEYLNDVPFIKNMFISSVDDGLETVEDLYACGTERAQCYTELGDSELYELEYYARVALGAELKTELNGNVVELAFTDLINLPLRREENPNVLRMNSEFPHIEYDGAKRRRNTYVFAAERHKKSVEVTGSEQLYIAVARGYRPIPTDGSAAQKVFASAKTRLTAIVGASYDDVQKVHAIYDWLQWVSIGGAYDKSSSANYLEAIFGSGETDDSDVRRAVVSKFGMAKAFAFLCGIEGIECEVITDGKDYRNVVTVNGCAYNIDVLGGKANGAALGIPRQAELNTHRMLFADDSVVADLGLFDSSSAVKCVHGGRSYYLQKTKADGAYCDKTLKVTDGYSEVKAAVFGEFSRSSTGAVSVPVLVGTETYINNAYGAEFIIFGKDEKAEANLISMLRAAVKEYAETVLEKSFGTVRVYRVGNNVHISASGTA